MGRPIVHPIGCAIVAAGFWVLPGTTAAWIPFGNEVTVYMVSCAGEQPGGTCRGGEKTDLPFTYKVSVDQQSVWYWRTDSSPHRLPFCTVRDMKSWLCQWEDSEIPRSRFGMVAGKYVEIPTCTAATVTTMPPFYQVSMWRWWLVRLREMLS